MTRSAYGPAWDLEANRRRLAVTRAVAAPLMAAQTTADWRWIVLLDERDPLLRERLAVYRDHAPAVSPLVVCPTDVRAREYGVRARQRIAAADYRAPWRRDVPADETVLMTRLDDDDGLAPTALARFQAGARGLTRRTALMLPTGIRVFRGRYDAVRHDRNAMHTLVTPRGDTTCVYDYGHTRVRQVVPVVDLDPLPGWLWVRHRDTISGWRRATRPLNPTIRGLFPIDWRALEACWR